MTDAEIIEWLNYWLATFDWNVPDERCELQFRDPARHLYKATGKDLRECVENAVKAQPTSATFCGIVPRWE